MGRTDAIQRTKRHMPVFEFNDQGFPTQRHDLNENVITSTWFEHDRFECPDAILFSRLSASDMRSLDDVHVFQPSAPFNTYLWPRDAVLYYRGTCHDLTRSMSMQECRHANKRNDSESARRAVHDGNSKRAERPNSTNNVHESLHLQGGNISDNDASDYEHGSEDGHECTDSETSTTMSESIVGREDDDDIEVDFLMGEADLDDAVDCEQHAAVLSETPFAHVT